MTLSRRDILKSQAAAIAATVADAERRGLLEQDAPAHWRATETGQRFLNDLQALFLPEGPPPVRTSESSPPGIAKPPLRSSPFV